MSNVIALNPSTPATPLQRATAFAEAKGNLVATLMAARADGYLIEMAADEYAKAWAEVVRIKLNTPTRQTTPCDASLDASGDDLNMGALS